MCDKLQLVAEFQDKVFPRNSDKLKHVAHFAIERLDPKLREYFVDRSSYFPSYVFFKMITYI